MAGPLSRARPTPAWVPFHDREALTERLQLLAAENAQLRRSEAELQETLKVAEQSLQDLKDTQRQLTTARELQDLAAAEGVRKHVSSYARRRDRGRETKCTDESGEASQKAQSDEFNVRDRFMELELLNGELKQGQAQAEQEAVRWETKAVKGRQELGRAQRKLAAVPKRYTETLEEAQLQLRDLLREKDLLEQEREASSTQAVKAEKKAQSQLSQLQRELNDLLDRVEEVEEDRDAWSRRLQEERSKTDALRKSRDDMWSKLESAHGTRAMAACVFRVAARGGDHLSASKAVRALQPYCPPDAGINEDALLQALRLQSPPLTREDSITLEMFEGLFQGTLRRANEQLSDHTHP